MSSKRNLKEVVLCNLEGRLREDKRKSPAIKVVKGKGKKTSSVPMAGR